MLIRQGMDAFKLALGCAILVAPGCTGLTSPSQPPRQDKTSSTVDGGKTPATAEAVGPATDPLSEEKRQQNLAAVRDFLQRTQDLPPAGERRTPSGDATDRKADASMNATGQSAHAAPASSAVPPAEPPRALANTHVELTPPPARPPQPIPVIQSVSIRVRDDASSPTTAKGADEKVTNAPLDLEHSVQLHAVDTVYADWKTQADSTTDFETQWRATMLQLALGRDAEAAALSPNLPTGSRQVLSAFVSAAVAARSAARNPQTVDDNQLVPADDLRRALAELADPVVARVALCRKVVTFGVYEEMAANEFVAGRPTPTIMYCEIRNFTSQKIEDDRFRTRLATRLELLTRDGKSAWQQAEPEIEDVSRTRRGDFFLAQRITLPANLPAGAYTLKVYVEDKLSAKANETAHPLTIMEQASVAKAGEQANR